MRCDGAIQIMDDALVSKVLVMFFATAVRRTWIAKMPAGYQRLLARHQSYDEDMPSQDVQVAGMYKIHVQSWSDEPKGSTIRRLPRASLASKLDVLHTSCLRPTPSPTCDAAFTTVKKWKSLSAAFSMTRRILVDRGSCGGEAEDPVGRT